MNPYHGGAETFKEIVERETNGEYLIDIFAGSLYQGEREGIEALMLGAVDFVVTASAPLGAWEPTVMVFAGIALNRGVGGVNPGAVEIALDQGAKIVWLPTFDADNHARAFGGTGTYGFNSMTLSFRGASRPRGHFTVMHNGRLTEDAKEVIDAVAAYGALLATGHVSKAEIYATVDYALAKGVRVIVTHPEFTVPNLDIETIVELSQQGIFMEFCAVDCFPIPHTKNIDQMKEMIDAVTPERAVLASDSGQPFSPKPPETLRVFVQCLHEKGMDEASIRRMCIDNPTHLLGLA